MYLEKPCPTEAAKKLWEVESTPLVSLCWYVILKLFMSSTKAHVFPKNRCFSAALGTSADIWNMIRSRRRACFNKAQRCVHCTYERCDVTHAGILLMWHWNRQVRCNVGLIIELYEWANINLLHIVWPFLWMERTEIIMRAVGAVEEHAHWPPDRLFGPKMIVRHYTVYLLVRYRLRREIG